MCETDFTFRSLGALKFLGGRTLQSPGRWTGATCCTCTARNRCGSRVLRFKCPGATRLNCGPGTWRNMSKYEEKWLPRNHSGAFRCWRWCVKCGEIAWLCLKITVRVRTNMGSWTNVAGLRPTHQVQSGNWANPKVKWSLYSHSGYHLPLEMFGVTLHVVLTVLNSIRVQR